MIFEYILHSTFYMPWPHIHNHLTWFNFWSSFAIYCSGLKNRLGFNWYNNECLDIDFCCIPIFSQQAALQNETSKHHNPSYACIIFFNDANIFCTKLSDTQSCKDQREYPWVFYLDHIRQNSRHVC